MKIIRNILAIAFLITNAENCLAAGVDRIEEHSSYAYSDWLHTSCGYGQVKYGYKLNCADYQAHGPIKFRNLTKDSAQWLPRGDLIRGTLTDDIKSAILDRDRFDVALAEGSFAEAWRMGGDTEQGNLWKRAALAKSKKHLKQLTGASVFENNPAKLVEAHTIVAAFPVAQQVELDLFISAQEAESRATLAALAPDAAARTMALRSIADRLFG